VRPRRRAPFARAVAHLGVLLLLASVGARAAEGGSTEYLGGYTAFAAGYVPPDPGAYLTSELYYYDASISRVAFHGRLAVTVGTDMYFDTLQWTQVTSHTLLGGSFGFGLALPFGYDQVRASLQPVNIKRSTSAFGLGDLVLVPGFLGWHSGDWYANFALSVYAPTGEYDPNQPLSLSRHFWALDSAFSGSLLTDWGFDLSASLGYTVNWENPDTQYKSGDVVHLDLALGQYLSHHFKVGLVGYAVVQVTPDSGSGAILGPFESDVYAAGAALEYDTKLRAREMSLQLRWYREFAAQNHLAGNALYLTLDLQL
jgi:hypothetical protein